MLCSRHLRPTQDWNTPPFCRQGERSVWRRILTTSWLVLLCYVSPCFAQESGVTHLFLVWDERGQYGYIDGSGHVRIRPQFDGALPFTEGLAAVSVGNKWGFIDPSGKIVVPLNYYAVSPYSDGVAAVTIATGGATRPCGYIDHAGQFVIKPQQEFSCRDFSEGYAQVEIYDEQVGEPLAGYVTKDGRASGGSLRADPFSEGWALMVGFDGSAQYVSSRAEGPISFNRGRVPNSFVDYYSPEGPVSEGLAEVCAMSSSWGFCRRFGFVNTQGKIAFMLPEGVRVEGIFKNGRALILQERTEEVKAELADGEVIKMSVRVSGYGYVGRGGKVMIPAKFSDARNFSEGLAAVSTGKLQPADRRDIAGSAAESTFGGEEEGSWLCINPAGVVVINKCGAPLSREELGERFPKFGQGFGQGFFNGLFFNKIYVGDQRTQGGRKAVYGYMNRAGKHVWIQPHGKNVMPPGRWR
jgi:hypothetical protein